MPISFIGTGSYVPDYVLANDDLKQWVDTNNDWIIERTGIHERHIALGVNLTDMAVSASKRAIEDAGINASEIDLIIVATISSENRLPSVACIVQGEIGADNAMAFDINAACTGFIYGVEVAEKMLSSGMYKTALVIGSEKLSRLINWNDRNTCVLFGDAAGAVVLRDTGRGGILATTFKSVPDKNGYLTIKNPGSMFPLEEKIEVDQAMHMSGPHVFKFATNVMVELVEKVIAKANLTKDDIAYIVPHQANKRIIDHAVTKLQIPEDKFFINVNKYGNTSSASVPLALDELRKQRDVKPGDKVVLVAFGGGLTAGAVIVEF